MSGRLNSSGSPLPTDEWTLCLFSTFLAESLQHSSIKVYLAAVRSLHIESGFPDPLDNCLQLHRVVRGIKRAQGSPSSHKRLPVTAEIMKLIHSQLSLSNHDDIMFWAACTLAFFGFLRSAEFTVPSLSAFNSSYNLTVNDVALDSHFHPTCMQVFIKASKTDPFRHGCSILIGKGSPPSCAIDALVSYLSLRGDRPGPLFLQENGQPLTRESLTQRLRLILQVAGVPGNYSSHSFRIGAATTAAAAGIPDHLIQVLGRWKSDAYKIYIQTSKSSIIEATGRLMT